MATVHRRSTAGRCGRVLCRVERRGIMKASGKRDGSVIRRLRRWRIFSASGAAVLAALGALASASIVCAAAVKTDHVEAELVAADTALSPGVPATVALRLAIEDGWHTYWRNPGDSGLPTTLEWKLPRGFVAGEIEWPAPKALPVGPLVNYGYDGEVLHLVTVTPPADL